MEFKVCRECKESRLLSEFSVLARKKSGTKYQCDCNTCRSEKRRNRSRAAKAQAIAYKGGKCNDCNLVVHQAAFEFHHVDPHTKAGKDPTHFLNDTKIISQEAKQELDKCVLLCANCHRVRHFSDLI